MSIYPCEVHATVVPGTLDAFYIRMQDRRDTWFRKVRLCREHALEFLELHDKDWKLVHPMYGIDFAGICVRCNGVFVNASAMSRMYIDVYIKGHEPVKYIAEYCGDCSMIVIDALDLVVENTQDDKDRLARIRGSLDKEQTNHRAEYAEGRGVVDTGGGSQDDPKAPDDNGESDKHPAHIRNSRAAHGRY